MGGHDLGFVVPQEREPKPATGAPKNCGLSNRQTWPAFAPSLTQGQIVKATGLTPLLLPANEESLAKAGFWV